MLAGEVDISRTTDSPPGVQRLLYDIDRVVVEETLKPRHL